jgi:hypothetical protein
VHSSGWPKMESGEKKAEFLQNEGADHFSVMVRVAENNVAKKIRVRTRRSMVQDANR